MSNFLLALYNITAGNVLNGTLPAGDYMIECAGAKGGDGYNLTNTKKNDGGAGSKGWIKIKIDHQISFRAVAGTKGSNSSVSDAGFPDGGKCGKWTFWSGIGSGGGSSSFYINGMHALVCGAGSRGYYQTNGAPAGGNEYNYVNNGLNNFIKITNHSRSTSSMKGGDGSICSFRPCPGGGGGYKGGIGGNNYSEYAASGESFVNKSLVYDSKISDGIENPNNDDGFVLISKIFTCPSNCRRCEIAYNNSERQSKDLYSVNDLICTKCSNKNQKPKEGKCPVKQTSSFQSFLFLRHKYYRKD